MKCSLIFLTYVLFSLLYPGKSLAQSRDAMQKLRFLEGQWKGAAEAILGPGKKVNMVQTENVQMKLNDRVLLIEGTGREQGQVVFQALAVAAYDSLNRKYTMKAFRDNGQSTDAYLDVKGENWLEWGFNTERGKIRYTIRLNSKGQWHEVGEFSPNGGETWYKSFEMTLDKLK
ncbi:DUF1579 family protein [Larkinella sp. VNQ87]|uniref:DUF1579 family protein n=1 Tax=Larkinella sp. VNQ87 TaxID=3400921 RepID=UPI003C0F9AFE